MGAVWMLARAHMRPRWRSIVLLTVVVGFVGTTVLASVAGARRSDSALPRFTTYSRSADAEITAGEATATQLREFAHSPGVAAVGRLWGFAISTPVGFLPLAGAFNREFGRVVDRPRLVSGRLVDPAKVDDINIGEALAAQLHLRVGGHLDIQSYSHEQVTVAEQTGNLGDPVGPNIRLRVVGIVRRPLDLGLRGAAGGVVVLTPAFTKRYLDEIGAFAGTILRVRAQHGSADVPRVLAAARRIFGGSPVFDVQTLAIESEGARDAIDVLTVALWVFAGVAAIAGLVAIGIMLGRDVLLTSADRATERALGLTRHQRVAASGMAAVPVAVGGALLALVGALAASPLFPIGQARRADPDPGLHADWLVLGLGIVAVVVVVLGIGALSALRAHAVASVEARGGSRASRTVGAVARAGLSPSATAGVRMATQPGRGRMAVPVRSAFLGAAFGALGVMAAFTFGTSLTHLQQTPSLYGWTWDFRADDNNVPNQHACGTTDAQVEHVSGVAALAELCLLNVELDGRPTIGWGFAELRGAIEPTVVAGRAPEAPGEVALGAVTLDALGKHVGSDVRVQGPGGTARYRIVGRVVLAQLSTTNPQPLADGATFTLAGLAPLQDPASGRTVNTGYYVGRFTRSADRGAVTKRMMALGGGSASAGPAVPVEVERLTQIDQLPGILAGLLGLLAMAAVGHALVTSVRRRRRDLAVLKTLGFERVQVRATVAWQATTLALVGLVVGIPLGVVVGKMIWRSVADNLGVSTAASVPVLAALVLLPAAVLLANVIAALPAGSAARTRPAVVLRSE